MKFSRGLEGAREDERKTQEREQGCLEVCESREEEKFPLDFFFFSFTKFQKEKKSGEGRWVSEERRAPYAQTH